MASIAMSVITRGYKLVINYRKVPPIPMQWNAGCLVSLPLILAYVIIPNKSASFLLYRWPPSQPINQPSLVNYICTSFILKTHQEKNLKTIIDDQNPTKIMAFPSVPTVVPIITRRVAIPPPTLRETSPCSAVRRSTAEGHLEATFGGFPRDLSMRIVVGVPHILVIYY